jgi:hypothetical protein
MGTRQQQQDTPINIITPSASQSQSQQASTRRVNFLPLQNDGISQQIRNDMPGIDALAALLQTSLQTAIHSKPSTNVPYTPDQVNSMPVKEYVHHLRDNYITSNKTNRTRHSSDPLHYRRLR